MPTFPPITIEQLLENWQKVLKQFTGIDLSGLDGGLKLFVEFIGGLFNIDFSDLANLPSPEDAWAQIAAKIFSVTGVNIASWPAFLASLDDGAGIDLPAVPRLVSALEGIDLSQPGSVLAAILAAAGFGDLLEAIIGEYHGDDEVLLAIQDIFMPLRRMVQLVSGNDVDWPTLGELESGWSHLFGAIGGKIEGLLSGLIDISWLTDQHQNLILESGYDSAVTVVAEDDPAITQDATDGVPDTDPLGCLRIALDGQQHYRIGELIAVGKGWELQVASRVKRESVSASAGSIRVELQPYSRAGDVVTPVGGRVSVCSVAAPGGSSSGWPESISGSWSVPSDGSVTHISVIPGVTAGAASGVVKFDNTTMFATQNIPQAFVNELTEDLDSLLNWIQTVVDTLLSRLGLPAVGTLLDRIHDLGDEIQLMQEQGEDALAGLADKLGLTDWNAHLAELLSNPGALLGQLGMGQTTGLSSAINEMNQVRDLLAGLVVTPINNTVQAIKDALGGQGLAGAFAGAGQDTRDAIVQALGGTGTGHTAADVLASLTAIPASVVQSGIDGVTNLDNGLQKILDGVVAGAGDLIGSGFSFADKIAQVAGLRKATAGAQAAVVDLQSQVIGLNPSASTEVVDFSQFVDLGTPPSMFTKIKDVGSGGIVTSGGQLAWSGSSAGREFFLFNGGPLQTDLFEVNFVLPSVPSHGWLGDDSSNFMYLIGRANAAGTRMVLARCGWDEIRIYGYNNGTFTELGAATGSDILTGGCRVSFKGGTVTETRRFTVAVNGAVVLNVLDGLPNTVFGSDYRLCGFGIEKGSSYATGKMSTWSMLDGGASAGSGTVAGYTVAGLTNMGIWAGTEAQYAVIGTKAPTTIYIATDS